MKSHLTDPGDLYLRVMAIVLLVAGVAMIFTEISMIIAFAVIAIGAALVVISFGDSSRRGGAAH
jgi:hypothetical protein